MRTFARVKHDGSIMNFNPNMNTLERKGDYDFFEWEGPVPEFIHDLPAFLAGKATAEAVARPKRKAADPVFLQNADGSKA